jgi:hypothetical protein
MSYELKNYSIAVISDHMQQFYPIKAKSNNSISYASIAQKYIDITVNALLYGDVGDANNTYYIWKDSLREKLINKYDGNNRWYTWLNENYPLFHTLRNGYTGKNPQASLVQSYVNIDELILYTYHNNHRLAALCDIPRGNLTVTPIDVESLSNYRDNLVYYNANEQDKTARDRRNRDIHRSGLIIALAEINNGNLVQAHSNSDWPRHYLTGLNLQNGTASGVRDAALGRVYKYDINSSAFAFKATVIHQWAQSQNIDYKPTAMLQLLSDKGGIRNMLAYDVLKDTKTNKEHKLELIKEAITSMGFGCDPTKPRNAIENIIWNAQDRERFVKHDWVQEFQTEQKLFSEVIRKTYDRAWVKSNMPSALKGTRYSQSKLEAYLYAQFETEFMTAIQHSIGAENILLWVHDCVYTRNRIDLDYFNRVPEQLGYPLIRFSCERVDPIRYNKLTQLETQLETHSHSDRIAGEEKRARDYVNNWIDSATVEIFANRVNIPIANVEIESAWEEYNQNVLRYLNNEK